MHAGYCRGLQRNNIKPFNKDTHWGVLDDSVRDIIALRCMNYVSYSVLVVFKRKIISP
jgi:hypothetical protein